MLKIERIEIKEFRGIRMLQLDFECANFGICGPNGTGKSGVVDAIEFCLTGDITRLSGQGTGDLSVKQHAPHVDSCKNPERSMVTITASIPSLQKKVTISRNVLNHRVVKLTPSDNDIADVINEVAIHPEFALSRREIVKYIVTPPGDRARDVQILLRLDEIEDVRKALTRVANECKRDTVVAESSRQATRAALTEALGLERLTSAELLRCVNERRTLLGLPALIELTEHTLLKEGAVHPTPLGAPPVLRKAPALASVDALQRSLAIGLDIETQRSTQAADVELKTLKTDIAAMRRLRQRSLVKAGIELIDGDACPLCDTHWNAAELQEYLVSKLSGADHVNTSLQHLAGYVRPVAAAIVSRAEHLERIITYCSQLSPKLASTQLALKVTELRNQARVVEEFVASQLDIDGTALVLASQWHGASHEVNECLAIFRSKVEALPDETKEDQAISYLTLAQERYEKSVAASRIVKTAKQKQAIADRMLELFSHTSATELESIYHQVAGDFTRFYSIINRDDELEFQGHLIPAPAKLNLDVDFYGRGLFPPGAYHSEGHQDGMGLCLYLALMKHTLGGKFGFAVLDDVLMSVDASHRREVCKLLRTEFPHTQFIITTHDRVWLQYMRNEGLIEHSQVFGSWTVDSGPRVWEEGNIWEEIEKELARENVPQAALLLRRFLEHTATGLADAIRAKVEFRGDGQYELEDLLPPVLTRWKAKLADAERAAKHWKQDEAIVSIAAVRRKVDDAVARANVERWAINKMVHYNEWANLLASEFRDVVDAFRGMLATMRCEKCQSYVYMQPSRGAPSETIRCTCGRVLYNLVMKG